MAAGSGAPMALLPDSRNRSATAVEGKSDMRAENVYSSIVLQHGGAGQQKIFTVPQGQTIPTLAGSVTAPVNAHQLRYTELTTSLTKAGELGSAIGDAAVNAIGATLENAAYTASSGAQRAFGATQFEVADVLSKTFFQFKVAGKLQIQGPMWSFPAAGGQFGSIGSSGNAITVAIASNGWPGTLRKLRMPILIARTDALEGVVGVAGASSLAFSATGADGQPCLLWVNLHSLIKGDVR